MCLFVEQNIAFQMLTLVSYLPWTLSGEHLGNAIYKL